MLIVGAYGVSIGYLLTVVAVAIRMLVGLRSTYREIPFEDVVWGLVLPAHHLMICGLLSLSFVRGAWRRWWARRKLWAYLDGAPAEARSAVALGATRDAMKPALMSSIGTLLILFIPAQQEFIWRVDAAIQGYAPLIHDPIVGRLYGLLSDTLARVGSYVFVGIGLWICVAALRRALARHAPWRTRTFFAFVDVMGHSQARLEHGPLVVDPELDRLKLMCETLAAAHGGYKVTWGGDGGLFAFPAARGRVTEFALTLQALYRHRTAAGRGPYVPHCRVVIGLDTIVPFGAAEDWHSDEINAIAKTKARRPVLATKRAVEALGASGTYLESDGLYEIPSDSRIL